MDRKRARYRNDSTPANDLLQSCETRGCHRRRYAQPRNVPVADDARSMRSARSVESERLHDVQGEQKPKKRTARKRSQKTVQEDDAAVSPGGQKDDSTPKKKKRKIT